MEAAVRSSASRYIFGGNLAGPAEIGCYLVIDDGKLETGSCRVTACAALPS